MKRNFWFKVGFILAVWMICLVSIWLVAARRYVLPGNRFIPFGYAKLPLRAAGPIQIEPKGQIFVGHAKLGYGNAPGKRVCTQNMNDGSAIRFSLTIGNDGYRVTSDFQHSGPVVWICGCSFVWGEWLSDNETMAWLIQESLPEAMVRNMGMAGYGNVHALVQLREVIKMQSHLPSVLVCAYNPFHMERNVAAPSRLAVFRRGHSQTESFFPLGELRHARAWIDDNGLVQTECVSWEWHEGEPDPSMDEQVRVTKAIFAELMKLCRENNIRPIFAFQSGSDNDPIVTDAREAGWVVTDIREDYLDPKLRFFDNHPNAICNQRYASKLLPAIKGQLEAARAGGSSDKPATLPERP